MVEELLNKLQSYDKGCEDKCLDLQTLQFDAESGNARLFNKFNSYYFKSNPENPRNPKIVYAAKQFCKLIGVPFSFFYKNPKYMKEKMVECWLSGLKSEKSLIMAKLRKRVNDYVIRALLPVEFTCISNSEIIDIIAKTIGEDFIINFVIGDERDDPILYIRFLSKEKFNAFGEECCCGFSIMVSELGACPICIDTLLYRNFSRSSLIASYMGKSFFSHDYSDIQADDLKVLFPQLINHLRDQMPVFRDKIQEAKEFITEKENMKQLLLDIRLKKGLTDRFHTLLQLELQKDEDIKNRWDFSNKMSIVAKEFDISKRLKIERVAGSLIGLNFEKE